MKPIHWAISSGNTQIAKLLIEADADINIKDNNDLAPLHWTASNGSTEIVNLFIAHGANLDDVSEEVIQKGQRHSITLRFL